MTNFIPIFPLKIVVYPGEPLNLHIFEPRYKQLIGECIREQKPFGIPTLLEGQHADLGTLMEVTSLEQSYDNGELDIRTRGLSVFRILTVVDEVPDKLYKGAIVSYPENRTEHGNKELGARVLAEVRRLYALLNVEEKLPVSNEDFISYQIAHYVGLSLEQEYELLGLFDELHRLEYLRRHLNAMIPVVRELEAVKARIQMNGHFRNLSAGDI